MRNFKTETKAINHLLMEVENSIESNEELEYVLSNIKERYIFEQRSIPNEAKVHHRMYGNGVVLRQIDNRRIFVKFLKGSFIISKGNLSSS